MATDAVRTGAERLASEPGLAGGGRFGLVTNFTGVLPDLRPQRTAFLEAGLPLITLFGPEHGLNGTAQAGASESARTDPETGLPVFDTYHRAGADLDALVTASGVDTLLFDIQDIGTRFYTYIWTMFDCLAAAARCGVRFIVLDRPNPLGGRTVEGPLLQPGFESFVGRAPIPVRHGLTVGELARQFTATTDRPAELDVITLSGWTRGPGTGQPWVPPSPNMPSPDCALVYPGTGLFEGTNLSEGRGTTRPFETIGAPFLDGRLVPALRERELPGVTFRGTWFQPTFSKYAGQVLPGVQLHLTDRVTFEPVRTALVILAVLRELYPGELEFRPELDRLWGSDSLRKTLTAGEDPEKLLPASIGPDGWTEPGVLLYEGGIG
ncbi:uncharacterized protein YbbC (DUF1343 family) [Kribbella amoyensis]|uniref:Uncharacterized protein YbbC (DUF1343 family) n=1 Tax=Kribbella amoyensis TaxID=996641 RepID=A0A561B8G9_9ACTN|nr:DUF1343 domain-containing protein [Kribbella amoyensis]TWD75266.1 uncharacterized protein YbbC (DUF1343 family) [Kribbella amoyensis]